MIDLEEITTKDGTISLKSTKFDESFHCHAGALKETQTKFINPSLIERYKNKSIRVLDVCFGLGYNSALLFNKVISQSTKIDWFALEIDKKPLNYCLRNKSYRGLWDRKVIKIFESLRDSNYYSDDSFNCKIVWGDARKGIAEIPEDKKIDLIFLDGFSPPKCPEIWTLDFLHKLSMRMNPEGYLITYCSAAAVRKSLINLGLKIFNIKPSIQAKNIWSNGTLATFNGERNNQFIEKLSEMEKEHLETKASIPYRDQNNNSFSEEIIRRRRQEQFSSKLLSTSYWRKKWGMTKSTFTS